MLQGLDRDITADLVMTGPAAMRQLQQQAGQAQATVVTTAQQLIDAIEGGALDIEVQEHLDLTPLAPRDTVERPQMLSDDSRATQDFGRSIRVRNSLFMVTTGCLKPNRIEVPKQAVQFRVSVHLEATLW